jgi:hypothetical protein
MKFLANQNFMLVFSHFSSGNSHFQFLNYRENKCSIHAIDSFCDVNITDDEEGNRKGLLDRTKWNEILHDKVSDWTTVCKNVSRTRPFSTYIINVCHTTYAYISSSSVGTNK